MGNGRRAPAASRRNHPEVRQSEKRNQVSSDVGIVTKKIKHTEEHMIKDKENLHNRDNITVYSGDGDEGSIVKTRLTLLVPNRNQNETGSGASSKTTNASSLTSSGQNSGKYRAEPRVLEETLLPERNSTRSTLSRVINPATPASPASLVTANANRVKEQRDQYLGWRNEQGHIVTFNSEERSVRKYARDTLFAKVKFITSDSELDYTGKFMIACLLCIFFPYGFCLFQHCCMIGKMCIAHVVCEAEHLDTNRWDEFRDFVREEIRQRRTNCNTSLKKEFIGKTIKQAVNCVNT
jgi:hypothetical protein